TDRIGNGPLVKRIELPDGVWQARNPIATHIPGEEAIGMPVRWKRVATLERRADWIPKQGNLATVADFRRHAPQAGATRQVLVPKPGDARDLQDKIDEPQIQERVAGVERYPTPFRVVGFEDDRPGVSQLFCCCPTDQVSRRLLDRRPELVPAILEALSLPVIGVDPPSVGGR